MCVRLYAARKVSSFVSFASDQFGERTLAYAYIIAAVCTVAVLTHESFTTVRVELRVAVPICRRVEALERAYRGKHGTCGGLSEISREEPELLVDRSIDSPCESGYCLAITSADDQFTVRVYRDPAYWKHLRYLSLYSDRTGAMRMSYGAPPAGPESAIVMAKQLAAASLRRSGPKEYGLRDRYVR